MKLVKPLPIDNLVLTSSTVTEADYPAYAAGTTYVVGDRVMLVSPASTVTVTIANPCVVTWTAHGQPVNTPLKFSTTGALPTGIVAGVTYFIANVTVDGFTISDRIGGTRLATSGTQSGTHTATAQVHRVYESLQVGNLGNYPSMAASSTWWLDTGSTNRWKMFDGSITSQTANASSISTVFAATGRMDSVACMNVSAATMRVLMHDAVDGDVYDHTYSLVSDSGITDVYAYCFLPIDRVSDKVITDLPPYANAAITVTLTATGETVLCGACILGQSREVGGIQYGASVGIQDYSVKQKDAFGNYSILERTFNKRGDFKLFVANSLVDQLEAILAGYRALPVLYVGSDSFSSTDIYGFYKDFSIDISYPDYSICSIQIEGLT